MTSQRDLLYAAQSILMETAMTHTHTPATIRMPSRWDAWWITARAASDVVSSITTDTIEPCGGNHLTTGTARAPDCACWRRWAAAIRRHGPTITWPSPNVLAAVVKPAPEDGDRLDRVTGLLVPHYRIIATLTRPLSTSDVYRLYPDAYGTTYLARLVTYLTSAPVTVLIVVSRTDTPPDPTRVKADIRSRVGNLNAHQNVLHLADSPGEAICDLQHFTSPDTARDLYERYDRDHAATRDTLYRTVLADRYTPASHQ